MKSKFITYKLSSFLAALLYVMVFALVSSAQPVSADHTLPHCREMYDDQVPEQVVEDCRNEVRQRCLENFTTEIAYEICLNGESPTTGQDGPADEETASGGLTAVDFGGDCEGNSENCCNGVSISVGVDCPENENVILSYLAGFINFLAIGVGLVVTAMIVVGGIEYIIAGGIPQKVEKAKSLITNAIIALVTFIFMYGILQWLIPGGLF